MSETSQQWNVGSIVVTSVVEHAVAGVPAQAFLPEADAELIARYPWLSPEYASPDGTIGLAVRAFVVRAKGTTILVDPCVGNGKQRLFPMWDDASFPFLQRLASVGVHPHTVRKVVHTHLHPDHCGWDAQRVDGADAGVCRASRNAFLKTVEERGALLLVNHFPGRCGGRVTATSADHYRFEADEALDVG